MGLQNLDISETLIQLGVFIKKHESVREFCYEHFGKELTVFVGDFTRKNVPDIKNCPYIVLTDFKKKEGQDVDFCAYEVKLFIGAKDETEVRVETEDGIIIQDIYDLIAKFENLLQAIFNDPKKRNRPLSRCEVKDPVPLDAEHWIGIMELTWRIYQTLGTSYQEEL